MEGGGQVMEDLLVSRRFLKLIRDWNWEPMLLDEGGVVFSVDLVRVMIRALEFSLNLI